jgi:hypothetical protein
MFYVFLKKSDQRTQKWINSRQTLRDAFDAHFFFFFWVFSRRARGKMCALFSSSNAVRR